MRRAITDAVQRDARANLTPDETRRFRELGERIETLRSNMARAGYNDPDARAVSHAAHGRGGSLAGQQLLTRDQKVTDWLPANGVGTKSTRPASFDRWLRGIVSG